MSTEIVEFGPLPRQHSKECCGWGITPFDLKSVGHGITEEFAKLVIHKKLLPAEEMNDGLILAEVAMAKLPALVTSDSHLLKITQRDLHAVLDERGLEKLKVYHPRQLGNLLTS